MILSPGPEFTQDADVFPSLAWDHYTFQAKTIMPTHNALQEWWERSTGVELSLQFYDDEFKDEPSSGVPIEEFAQARPDELTIGDMIVGLRRVVQEVETTFPEVADAANSPETAHAYLGPFPERGLDQGVCGADLNAQREALRFMQFWREHGFPIGASY